MIKEYLTVVRNQIDYMIKQKGFGIEDLERQVYAFERMAQEIKQGIEVKKKEFNKFSQEMMKTINELNKLEKDYTKILANKPPRPNEVYEKFFLEVNNLMKRIKLL